MPGFGMPDGRELKSRLPRPLWGRSSVGRAMRSQRIGRGFKSLRLHHEDNVKAGALLGFGFVFCAGRQKPPVRSYPLVLPTLKLSLKRERLMTKTESEIEAYLNSWPAGREPLKKSLLELKGRALGLENVKLDFIARPGVSHSFRFDLDPRPDARKRRIFCMMDVVEMDGEAFLSVCFYQEEITDPDELGDGIPGGLLGEDGYCFDLEPDDHELAAYLAERIDEAHKAALGG